MRILFIGNYNLRNDVIAKILSADDRHEVNFTPPEEIFDDDIIYKSPKYDVSVIDLNELSMERIDFIKEVKAKRLAANFIVLYSDVTDGHQEQYIEAGADRCLSIDCSTKDLIDTISELGKEKLN